MSLPAYVIMQCLALVIGACRALHFSPKSLLCVRFPSFPCTFRTCSRAGLDGPADPLLTLCTGLFLTPAQLAQGMRVVALPPGSTAPGNAAPSSCSIPAADLSCAVAAQQGGCVEAALAAQGTSLAREISR